MNESGKFLFLDPHDQTGSESETDSHAMESFQTVQSVLDELIRLLHENGFDPVTQLTAYLVSEDPTYLPEDTDIRSRVRHIGRDKLLENLLELYIQGKTIADVHD